MGKNNVSRNIRQHRKALSLTQSELAEKMNVSVKSVSHWERDYCEPSINQLIQLSEIFDVTLDELIL